jgi:hypothetical protein
MSAVIVPKSDQLNADSLLVGPITITITEVSIRPGTEQPVTIHYEGENGKPWKPCKSMCKVMVACWKEDANQYVGRSLTLWNDPKVKWGGMAVGGLRITHMSHISGTHVMALTETKGSKKPFTVHPLVAPTPKTTVTIASWINDKLAPTLDAAKTTADLAKIQQGKAYLSATERGTDEDRTEMKRMVDAALLRIDPPVEVESGTTDDTFPGDR